MAVDGNFQSFSLTGYGDQTWWKILLNLGGHQELSYIRIHSECCWVSMVRIEPVVHLVRILITKVGQTSFESFDTVINALCSNLCH